MNTSLKKSTLDFYNSYRLQIILTFVTVVWVSVFMYILSLQNAWGDDLIFAQAVQGISAIDWLNHRWNTWSSRIFPELMLWIFAPISRTAWVFASGIFYIFYIFLLYKTFLLLIPNIAIKGKIILHSIVCISPWLLSLTTFAHAILWLTGSINYFWIGVLFLAAIYTPLYIAIKNLLPSISWIVSSIGATIVVSISHEQFGLSLVILYSIISFIYLAQQNKMKSVIQKSTSPTGLVLTLTTIAAVCSLSLALTAPGNTIRLERETKTWQPDIHTVSLESRVESDIRWFFERTINSTGLILVILWTLLGVLVFKIKQYRYFAYIFFIVAILSTLSKLFASPNVALSVLYNTYYLQGLFNFHASWGYNGGMKSWLPIIFWGIVLLLTAFSTYLVLKKNIVLMTISLSLLAVATISLAALWMSPTMYASGDRVVYTSSILVTLLCMILFSQLSLFKEKRSKL